MRHRRLTYGSILLLAALIALPGLAATQAGPAADGYDLSWWTVDGGGATAAGGGDYALAGTAGQPDAAVWRGGDYTLAGGFWGATRADYRIYLPVLMRNA